MRFQFSLSRGICASCWCHSCLMFIVRWRRVVCAQEVILRYEDEPHLWHCVAEEVPWFRQLSGLGNAVELLTFSGCFLYNSLGYLNQQYRFSVLEVLVVLCYREKTLGLMISQHVKYRMMLQIVTPFKALSIHMLLQMVIPLLRCWLFCVCYDGLLQYIYCAGKV